MEPINYLSVLVAALAMMGIGALWYSPPVFGKIWIKTVGKTKTELTSYGTSYMLIFITSLVSAYILALLLSFIKISTISGGLMLGFQIWLGFITTGTLAVYIFEKRPAKLYLIFNFCQLLSFLAAGAILAAWR
jgi:hypothetical protein